jgi:hypothetical protein
MRRREFAWFISLIIVQAPTYVSLMSLIPTCDNDGGLRLFSSLFGKKIPSHSAIFPVIEKKADNIHQNR